MGVIEAMYNGVLPIVCDRGGPAENVAHNVTGVVVDCSKHENADDIAMKFADEIVKISQNKERYGKMIREAKHRSATIWSRDAFAVQYGSLYEILMMSRRSCK